MTGEGPVPPMSGTSWPAHRRGMPRPRRAPASCRQMAMMASGKQVDVDSVAPEAPKVTAALEEVSRQYPPHRLTSAAMDPKDTAGVQQAGTVNLGFKRPVHEGYRHQLGRADGCGHG